MSPTVQQITTIHILDNTLCKDNQAMKFDELIKYLVRNIFLQKSCRQWGSDPSSRLHFLKKKLYMRAKEVITTLVLIYFGRPLLGHIIKTNFISFQIVDPKICSILIFYKRFWDWFLHNILNVIFGKYISILFTDQI